MKTCAWPPAVRATRHTIAQLGNDAMDKFVTAEMKGISYQVEYSTRSFKYRKNADLLRWGHLYIARPTSATTFRLFF